MMLSECPSVLCVCVCECVDTLEYLCVMFNARNLHLYTCVNYSRLSALLSKVLLTMHVVIGATHAHIQHVWSWLPRKEGHSPADIFQRLSVLIWGQVYNLGIADVICATLLSHMCSPAMWWASWAEMSSSAAFLKAFCFPSPLRPEMPSSRKQAPLLSSFSFWLNLSSQRGWLDSPWKHNSEG